jgi:hypothetical protein
LGAVVTRCYNLAAVTSRCRSRSGHTRPRRFDGGRRSSAASTATWSSSWRGNARGPTPTTSAAMTRWWILMKRGPITPLVPPASPQATVTVHFESRSRSELPAAGRQRRSDRHRAVPARARHHPGQPAGRPARGHRLAAHDLPVPVAKAITQALSCSHPTLRGPDLRKIRLHHPELQSPAQDGSPSADDVTQASVHSTRCGC